jgi:putative ABC transport system permease protein
MNDLRFAVRQLRRNPGFTVLVVFTLALGIGANTAVFSVINAVVLRPLPFSDPDRLVTVWQEYPTRQPIRETFSYPNFADLNTDRSLFAASGAYCLSAHTLDGAAEPERLGTVRVSSNLLETLGVRPALGRDFRAEDDRPEAERVALLSDHLWRRQFHADSSVIDHIIRLNDEAFRIVGVLPKSFRLGDENPDLLLPLRLKVDKVGRGERGLTVIARLQRGISAVQVSYNLQRLAARLRAADPWSNADLKLSTVPLHEQFAGPMRLSLLVLIGAVTCVLAIACVNVANLTLVRASARQAEFSIRAAIGAGRGRIVRQQLVESLVLSVVGGAAGLVLGVAVVSVCQKLIVARLPQATDLSLDYRVLGYTLTASMLTGLLAGLFPALAASRVALAESLQQGARNVSASRGAERHRNLLVALEVSLAFALLVGAGVFLRSLGRLHQADLGFDTANLLTVQTWLTGNRYNDNDAVRRATVRELCTRLQSLPGVEAVTFGNSMPLGDDMDLSGLSLDGRTFAANDYPMVHLRGVGPDYFRTLRAPVLAGRDLAESDTETAQKVAVINASMVRRYWPNESPLGRRIRPDIFADKEWRTIVGVIADIKNESVAQPPRPEAFYPYMQAPTRGLSLIVRTQIAPHLVADAVRQAVWRTDRALAIAVPRTAAQLAAESFSATTFQSVLLGSFAGIALLLAMGGIYSVVSFTVCSRTREIGIRIALGAQASTIYRLVLHRGVGYVLLGIAIGTGLGLVGLRFLARLLFEVSPADPATFFGVAVLLLLAALSACYFPARRAAAVDPTIALRQD